MPVSRPKTRKRNDPRLRVTFDTDERLALAGAAGPDGLAQAAYARKATMDAIARDGGAVPSPPAPKQKRHRRTRAYFTLEEEAGIAAKAKARGLTVAEFQRMAALSFAGLPTKPKKRKQNREEVTNLLHVVATQIKKLGTNCNQLAHRHNAGLPIAPEELRLFKNQHQVLMSAATAAVEKMLA